MESQPQSDKPITILTVADLEAIIVKIVQIWRWDRSMSHSALFR